MPFYTQATAQPACPLIPVWGQAQIVNEGIPRKTALELPLFALAPALSLHSSHTGLLAVATQHTCSPLRDFAIAVPSACNIQPCDMVHLFAYSIGGYA